MGDRSMDLDRAEEIARDPSAATPRQLRDAWFHTCARVGREDRLNALLPWERRRYEAVFHRLSIYRSQSEVPA